VAEYKSFLDRMRSLLRTMKIRTGGVHLPSRLHLVPLRNPSWRDPGGIEENRRHLLTLRFTEVGVYSAREIPNMQIAYFAHQQNSIVATIYESRHAGMWVDFLTDYEDGTSFNYTSAPKGRIHDVPEWDHQESHSSLSINDLYLKFLRDRPQKTMRQVTPENVISNAEEAFAAQYKG
jgi:hypothetical protein